VTVLIFGGTCRLYCASSQSAASSRGSDRGPRPRAMRASRNAARGLAVRFSRTISDASSSTSNRHHSGGTLQGHADGRARMATVKHTHQLATRSRRPRSNVVAFPRETAAAENARPGRWRSSRTRDQESACDGRNRITFPDHPTARIPSVYLCVLGPLTRLGGEGRFTPTAGGYQNSLSSERSAR
jgi:hypothetical protein